MSIKHSFCKHEFVKIVCALFLTVAMLLLFAGCHYGTRQNAAETENEIIQNSENTETKSADAETSDEENSAINQIYVTDQPYDFVNSNNLPENDNTEYRYDTEMKITDPKRIFYGAGTCSYLEGKKTVVLFFVDDDVSRWSANDIQDFTDDSVFPALEFIEREAKLRKIDLSFDIWRFSSAFSTGLELNYNGTVNPDLFNGGSTKDLFSQAAQAFGYSCDMAFRWALMKKSGSVEIIPVFLLNKGGISYARNNYIVGPVEAAEHAVVFSDSEYGTRNQSATFAHELLHLYGAEELYMPAQRYALSVDLYPHDIMCLETRNLSKLKIDGFTAYTLGWNKTMPNICNNQDWYSDSYYQNYRDWFE